jgi:hypothetical protein
LALGLLRDVVNTEVCLALCVLAGGAFRLEMTREQLTALLREVDNVAACIARRASAT